MYPKADVDRVIAEKNEEIAKLKADYKEACDRLQTVNLIKDEQKARADELQMKVSGLEKLVETADKVIKKVASQSKTSHLKVSRWNRWKSRERCIASLNRVGPSSRSS